MVQRQSRDLHPTTRNQFNIVLINDGTGYFPSRIELPRARFYRGFTAVADITDFDIDGDGLQDLLRPLPPERFLRGEDDLYFGYGAVVADVNGDGVPDFVVPLWEPGLD